jgi:ubiquinone biosynthesis protein COQ9
MTGSKPKPRSNSKPQTASKTARQDAVLMAALPHVVFDGWTPAALRRGAADAGLAPEDADLLFPGGGPAAIAHFIALADRMMVEDLARHDLSTLKHREKVALIVRLRLQRWTPHREAVRRALALTPLPAVAGTTLQGWYATVDAMWKAIGDRSVDFNFYTKRALLAGVYGATLLYWLNDRSEGCTATWAFLERRIDNVMQVPKLRQRLEQRLARLPNPLRLFAALRR